MITIFKNPTLFLPSIFLLICVSYIIYYLLIQITPYEEIIFLDKYYLYVIFFTIYQAFLGAALSVLLALFFIGSLYKLNKAGFYWIAERFISIPFFLPSIVGCLSLVMVFGQNGLIAKIFTCIGLPYKTFIYGICGIVLCHVFYYVPYILRIFCRALDSLPTEYDYLANHLNMHAFSRLKFIYYPVIKEEIFNAFSITFMYCFRSFTTILIFGGLPGTTTLEVALYQALNFDSDWNCAAQLALAQIIVNSGLFFTLGSIKKGSHKIKSNHTFYNKLQNLEKKDLFIFLIMCVFFLLPLLCLIIEGLSAFSIICLEFELWSSILVTLGIGFASTLIAFTLLLPLCYVSYFLREKGKIKFSFFLSEMPVNISMICSPIVIIAIFYMIFSNLIESVIQFIFIISLVNAICFLPSMYRVTNFNYQVQRKKYDDLCALLNIRGIKRFFLIDFTSLKASFGYATSICIIFSMGDSRAILFFSQFPFHSLISFLYDKMKMYLFEEAAAIALLILILSFIASLIIEKCLGKHI